MHHCHYIPIINFIVCSIRSWFLLLQQINLKHWFYNDLYGFQVFLEPFSLVLGQSKSKRVLISVSQSDTRHLNCLHRLGIVLGITDWVKDYQKKLDPSQSPQMVPVELAKVKTHSGLTVWMRHLFNCCYAPPFFSQTR